MITRPVLADFRSAVRGSVRSPSDDGYDAARQIFNAMIDHRPGLIARCVSAADVVACVGFARAPGLAVSARGGGHNVSGKVLSRHCPDRRTSRPDGGGGRS
jgi:FAD/FMN-containing dehydrogenase